MKIPPLEGLWVFLAHPENYLWGRVFLLVVFSLAIGVPLTIAWAEERRATPCDASPQSDRVGPTPALDTTLVGAGTPAAVPLASQGAAHTGGHHGRHP